MKNSLLTITLLMTLNIVNAQNDKLSKVLGSVLTQMHNANDKATMQNTVNMLERIANAEASEWLPSYYAGYGNAMLSFMEEDVAKKQALNDKALEWHKKSKAAEGDEVELLVLEAMVYQAMIQVDPMTMGMQYGPKATKVLYEARAKDPANPRADMMLGQNLYYTPAMYGGGAENGCPLILSAAEKFKTFKPASEIHPNWGEARNIDLIKMCKE